MSAPGTSLPKRCAALCLELAKGDVHLTGIRRGSLMSRCSSERRAQTHRRAAALLTPRLLYDLIRPREERGRHIEPEGLSGVQVDHQLKLGWQLDWQVGGRVALEDAIDIRGRLSEKVGKIDAVGH